MTREGLKVYEFRVVTKSESVRERDHLGFAAAMIGHDLLRLVEHVTELDRVVNGRRFDDQQRVRGGGRDLAKIGLLDVEPADNAVETVT